MNQPCIDGRVTTQLTIEASTKRVWITDVSLIHIQNLDPCSGIDSNRDRFIEIDIGPLVIIDKSIRKTAAALNEQISSSLLDFNCSAINIVYDPRICISLGGKTRVIEGRLDMVRL